ncbi:uncharacterized protein Hap1MRO34_018456 [Clarias gariepinus]|uniref:uncharacterized protein LOC128545094 n=1 Tax=Clarias gariepinus TaxID=13013 RepID=UPI00234DD6CF|nr:uncharacterized protein LOC128545094 [Clarias gariepinus]
MLTLMLFVQLSGKEIKSSQNTKKTVNTRLVKKKTATMITRRHLAVASSSKEQLRAVTRSRLNLEARLVSGLEAGSKEKITSHLPTADQALIHDPAGDHSTPPIGRLDDEDFGFPPAASTALTDHAVKVEIDPENVANLQMATGSILDFHSSPVLEHLMPNSQEHSAVSSFCSRLPETPRNASRSHHPVRRSLIHGVIIPDVTLNHVSIEQEKELYLNSAGPDGRPRVDRFAVDLFKRLVPHNVYQKWAGSVNYDGSRGKNALPSNLRQAISNAVAKKFQPTARNKKQIRDRINELLRKKRLSFPLF